MSKKEKNDAMIHLMPGELLPDIEEGDDWVRMRSYKNGKTQYVKRSELRRRLGHPRSPEDAKAIAKLGGEANRDKWHKMHDMRKVADMVVGTLVHDADLREQVSKALGIPENEVTYGTAMMWQQASRAALDPKAVRSAEFIRDTNMGKPGVGTGITTGDNTALSINFLVVEKE